MPRRGMHHQPRRLVDNDEVGILIKNVERDILGFGHGGRRFRYLNRNGIVQDHRARWTAAGLPIDRDAPVLDHLLEK